MNITLWITAGFLAIAYLTVGMMKIVRPYESIVANRNMGWAKDVAPAGVKVIGGIEIIGALGLILPQATGIAELLTPLAASGLIAFQLVAFVIHARRKGVLEPSGQRRLRGGRAVRGGGPVHALALTL